MSAGNRVQNSKGPLVINITNLSECYYCRTSLTNPDAVNCPSCGFPQRGTEEEQKKFITDKRAEIARQESLNDLTRKAKFSLFAVAAVMGLSFLISASMLNLIDLISWATLCLIFVGLGIWANKNPFVAVLTGTILYVATMIYLANNLAYNMRVPFSVALFYGYLWKIIIIAALIYGLIAAKKARELKSNLNISKRI